MGTYYHFTRLENLLLIRDEGITRGDVATAPLEGFDAPWLTSNPDRDLEGFKATERGGDDPMSHWARQDEGFNGHSSKIAVRLTVEIPEQEEKDLHSWEQIVKACSVNSEWNEIIESPDTFVFAKRSRTRRGRFTGRDVPPEWITQMQVFRDDGTTRYEQGGSEESGFPVAAVPEAWDTVCECAVQLVMSWPHPKEVSERELVAVRNAFRAYRDVRPLPREHLRRIIDNGWKDLPREEQNRRALALWHQELSAQGRWPLPIPPWEHATYEALAAAVPEAWERTQRDLAVEETMDHWYSPSSPPEYKGGGGDARVHALCVLESEIWDHSTAVNFPPQRELDCLGIGWFDGLLAQRLKGQSGLPPSAATLLLIHSLQAIARMELLGAPMPADFSSLTNEKKEEALGRIYEEWAARTNQSVASARLIELSTDQFTQLHRLAAERAANTLNRVSSENMDWASEEKLVAGQVSTDFRIFGGGKLAGNITPHSLGAALNIRLGYLGPLPFPDTFVALNRPLLLEPHGAWELLPHDLADAINVHWRNNVEYSGKVHPRNHFPIYSLGFLLSEGFGGWCGQVLLIKGRLLFHMLADEGEWRVGAGGPIHSPWLLTGLFSLIDKNTSVIYEPTSRKKWARKADKIEIKLRLPRPKPFYRVKIQKIIVGDDLWEPMLSLPTSYSHRWDRRGHERCRVQRGVRPMPLKVKKRLLKRGYLIFDEGPIDSMNLGRLTERGIPAPSNVEWVAIKVSRVRASVCGPGDKPYVPSRHTVENV
jgi:hypothetical protein